jgi:hypothetical protein
MRHQQFEFEELEEKIGQGAQLALMVYADPDNATLWDKLKAWSLEHKSYVSDSYEPSEAKGYDISKI